VTSSPSDIALLMGALRFAADKHRDQRRKDRGSSPYINHPIGIGYLLFVIPFLGWHRKDIVPAAAPLVAVKPALALAVPRQVGIVTRR